MQSVLFYFFIKLLQGKGWQEGKASTGAHPDAIGEHMWKGTPDRTPTSATEKVKKGVYKHKIS